MRDEGMNMGYGFKVFGREKERYIKLINDGRGGLSSQRMCKGGGIGKSNMRSMIYPLRYPAQPITSFPPRPSRPIHMQEAKSVCTINNKQGILYSKAMPLVPPIPRALSFPIHPKLEPESELHAKAQI